MNRLATLTLSLVSLLIAFPLISIGTTSGPPVLWWIGLAALAIGGVLPPLRRAFPPKGPLPKLTKLGPPENERDS